MSFNTEQRAYQDFREVLRQRTQQVVVWAGAGLSATAGIPTWFKLKQNLIDAAEKELKYRDENLQKKLRALIDLATGETDFWLAFQHLKEGLGPTIFRSQIRHEFGKLDDVSPPKNYRYFWKLGVSGFLTTNMDKFCRRSYSEIYGGQDLCDFTGTQVGDFIAALKTGQRFVANLHGTLDNEGSWVFTRDELSRLLTPSYKEFVRFCINSKIILFAGVSPDDEAVYKHFQYLKNSGVNFGNHFWLTHRNDKAAHEFAQEYNLLRIHYNLKPSENDQHGEIDEFLLDLERYFPLDKKAPIVIPEQKRERNVILPEPTELAACEAEEIRNLLNKEAVRILSSDDPTREQKYSELLSKYDDCAFRSWYVSIKEPKNKFFGYTLKGLLSTGGSFGKVYDAEAPDGERVAIKVLHENVREEPAMLESFRRGVHAMKILSSKRVDGVVLYKQSWEVPAATVMEYIDGLNLEEAVNSGFIKDWSLKLRISKRIVEIIRGAHRLPEHVLHRDVRPANIMLKDFHSPGQLEDWEVVMLDFDLCWHRDAIGNSIDTNSIAKGYHAPEQSGVGPKVSRRSALVDSFGVGMTLFFLCVGKHPMPQQVQHINWEKDLYTLLQGQKSSAWISLPTRVARLILWSTKFDQRERWDLTRIYGELERLSSCQDAKVGNLQPDIIAEEIAARCPKIGIGEYTWNINTSTAYSMLPTGFEIQLKGDVSDRSINLSIDWFNKGDRDYETVRKYIHPATPKVLMHLKAGGWMIDGKDQRYDRIHIAASVNLPSSSDTLDITRLAKSLAEAIGTLKLS